MNILALDTATQLCSLALVKDGQLAVQIDLTVKAGHSGSLLPAVDRMLEMGGLAPKDIDLVACGLGPGSFTGIRIGLATAKGLAAGLGCKLAGVSTLDALAAAALPSKLPVLPLIDARKGEVFCARYSVDGTRETAMLHLKPEQVAELAGGPCLLTGDGLAVYGDQLKALLDQECCTTPTTLWRPNASIIAKLAEAAPEKLVHEIKPFYVRDSDATLALNHT